MKRQYGLLAMLFATALSAHAEQPATEMTQPAETTQPAAMTQPAETTQPTTTAPAQQATTAPQQMKEQAGFSTGSVVRSAFTSAVENREPTDNLKTVESDQNQLYFFTELRDMSGQTATHRWEHNGKVMAEVEFNVKGPRWRVWSSKKFEPDWTGKWTVSVLNGAGDVISKKSFTYETAAAQQAAPSAAPEAGQAQ